MLEVDAYETGGAGGRSSNTAGKASFSGSVNSGGKTSGGAGAPSQPVTPTTRLCAQYCANYAKTCASELNGDNCAQLCSAEIDSYGPTCQALGLEAIKCLTPYFTPGVTTCDLATDKALAQCGTMLAKFKDCEKGSMPAPSPAPTPKPDYVNPRTCPSMGTVSERSCFVTFGCPQGIYDVKCTANADAKTASCSCYHGDSSFTGDLPITDFNQACSLAVTQCQ